MQMRLKRKYTCRNEPDKWKGVANARYKNMAQWRGSGSSGGNHGAGTTKGIKPLSFSGRTCGRMLRRHDSKAKGGKA